MLLRLLRWSIQWRYFWPKEKNRLRYGFIEFPLSLCRYHIVSVPKFRHVFLFLGVPIVGLATAFAFGVQSVAVITEVRHATLWFTLAAMYLAICVAVADPIKPKGVLAKVFVIGGLEAAVVLGYLLVTGWVSAKASDAAWNVMTKDAHESKVFAFQTRLQMEARAAALSKIATTSSSVSPVKQVTVIREKPEPAPQPASKIPQVTVGVAVGGDLSDHIHFNVVPGGGESWNDQLAKCVNAQCYTENWVLTYPIPLHLGDRGWARIAFLVYNIGDVKIEHATSLISVVSPTSGVSIDRRDQRHSYEQGNQTVESPATTTEDIITFSQSDAPYAFMVDVTVSPLVRRVSLLFRIFSNDLKVHYVPVTLDVDRD